VGYYVNGSSDHVVFAEALTTAGWATLSPVIPTRASSSELSGVSCLSATSCTAVGSYNNGTDTVTLIEHWTGGKKNTWVVQPTTPPTGSTYGELTAVSVNPGTAVGFYYPTTGPEATLAERWNGKQWVIQKTPNPTRSLSTVLNAVSCTSSGAACTAVGFYYNTANTTLSVAEHWNGKAWVIQKSMNPKGAFYSELYGVSCSSGTACTAVGYFVTSSPLVALAERWNGKTWALESTPTGVSDPWLTGVSCSSATACTAVGFGDDSPSVTLAEQWNGNTNKWAVQTTPNQGSNGTVLSGVSCLSATECIAAGSSKPTTTTYATLAELYS